LVEAEFDLFGMPVRDRKGKPGRPRYEATEKDRNKVKMLLALGWGGERVANGVGVSLATLKRYFRAELSVREKMRDRLDARRLEIAMEQANQGNIAALKELGRMIERNDLMALDRRIADDQAHEPDEIDDAKLGKKAMASKAAETAGDSSEWGSDLRFGASGRKN
jgi:hypothetical protein